MKKTTVLTVFLLLNFIAFSQNVGLRIGRNISNYSFNKDSLANLGITKDNLSGWAAAIPISFDMGKYVSVQTELSFVQKGFKSVQNISSGTIPIKTELKNYTNYAVLPVLIRFHTAGRFLQAYANVGPDATYAINSKASGSTTIGNTTSEVSQEVSLEGTKRLTVGLQGGAGLKFKVGRIALVLDGRFLTDLQDREGNFNIQGLKDNAFSSKNWITSFGIVFGR